MLFTLGLFWVDLIYQLALQWTIYPQYSYGWTVPLLVGFFLWKRWPKRPSPEPTPIFLPRSLICIFAGGFLAARFVQEANLIWRVPIWLMSFQVVGMTLLAIFLVGGRSWLKHFAFPILFFFIAVPWLRPIEEPLIQVLTRFNARSVVELFTIFGVPVFQQGNVIETSRGLVGIDEACSGVRSFQAILMLGLLLGEFYFLPGKQRGQLVLSGIAFTLAANILRTATLVFICARQGIKAMDKWHDPTGVAILAVCFVSLWGMAQLFVRKRRFEPHTHPKASSLLPSRVPTTFFLSVAVFFLGGEVSIETWYRLHSRAFSENPLWEIEVPKKQNQLREFAVSKPAQDRLRYDEGHAFGWNGEDGHKWQMLYFRWKPARTRFERVVVQDGKNHVPESCLSASGKNLISDAGIKLIQINGRSLPFRTYVFADDGQSMHVYFCLWQDYFAQLTKGEYKKYFTNSPRLAALVLGNRSFGEGLQVLELAVWGMDNQQAADKAVERELQRWIRMNQ